MASGGNRSLYEGMVEVVATSKRLSLSLSSEIRSPASVLMTSNVGVPASPRVVNQDVGQAQLRLGRVAGRPDLSLVHDIEVLDQRAPPSLADLPRRSLRTRPIGTPGDRHVRARAGELGGDGPADA